MGINTPFEVFPVLETERFRLREIELSDAANMFNYFSRDEVTEFYDLDTFTSVQQAIELVESLKYRYQSKRQIRWGITLINDNEIIGSCGLHAIEPEHYKAEIGYELHPDFWGKGVMTEVINRIVEYGFKEMNLNRIEALYNPLNTASQKVLEKNGFKFEGILRNRFFGKGRFLDAAVSSILKGDNERRI